MAENTEEYVNLGDFGDDDIISLSDDDLDNILDSTDIPEAEIADIDIDLTGDDAFNANLSLEEAEEDIFGGADAGSLTDADLDDENTTISGMDMESDMFSAPQTPAFTLDDEDEAIALSSDELDGILDEAESPFVDEAEGPDDMLIMEEELPAFQDAPVLQDDEFVIEDTGVVLEEESFSPVLEEEDDELLTLDDALDDFESFEPAVFHGEDNAAVGAVTEKEEAEQPIMSLDGGDLDSMLDTGTDLPEPAFEREVESAAEEVAVLSAGEEDIDLLDDDFDLGEPEASMQTPVEKAPVSVPFEDNEDLLFDLNEEDADLDMPQPISMESSDLIEPSSLLEDELEEEEIVIDDLDMELESMNIPVVDEPAQDEDTVQIMDDEIVFEEDTIPAELSMPEPMPDLSEDLAAPEEPFLSEAAFDIAEQEIPFVAPDEQEILDEELLEGPATAGIIEDDDISEMENEILSQPEAIPELSQPAADVKAEFQGMPEQTKQDVKKVLSYLDGLFDDLPEAKVKEFAQSEYYDIYSRLFKELGL